MRQYAVYIWTGLVVLAVTACNTTGGAGRLSGSYDFEHYLQSGYEQLAEYEEFLDGDEEAARHFILKARNAGRRDGVAPDMADDSAALPDKELKDVSNSYAILTDALTHLNTPENARFLAEAQVNYDCWLERLSDKVEKAGNEKDSRPVSNKMLIESCRSMFFSAIKSLHIPGDMQFSVFFDSGEAILGESAVNTVGQTALSFIDRDLWRIRLIGRTDSTGNYEDNVILSMRRAIAVRNALAQHGVDPDKIVIEAVGAVDANPDADKSKSRRVDMIIAPNYIAFDHKGPDIHQIVPHFFGSEEGDM